MNTLPERPTVADFQRFVTAMVDENHFTKDPNEVFVLFTEEVGELAKELRKKWKFGKEGVAGSAGGEIADVFLYLMDLANHFGVDVEDAVRKKVAANEGRTWEF